MTDSRGPAKRPLGRRRRHDGEDEEGLRDAPTEVERRYEKRLFETVGKMAGVESHVAQAVLWFYEQQMYFEMGAVSARSEYFSDGARKFLEQHNEETTSRTESSAGAPSGVSSEVQGATQAQAEGQQAQASELGKFSVAPRAG